VNSSPGLQKATTSIR